MAQDAPDNPLKALRAELEREVPKGRKKRNHTLYLSEPQYSQFETYCEEKGLKPSAIIDRMIALYMAAK